MYCMRCNEFAEPKRITPGSNAITVILVLLFILPGVLYMLWRRSAEYQVCGLCGSRDIVPNESPIARRVAERIVAKMGMLILLLVFLASVGVAQTAKDKKRQLKEQEKAMMERDLEVAIKASPDKIKALIIRAMLDQKFNPDKDSDYQLTFTGEARGANAFAYGLGRSMAGSTPEQTIEEIRFVLIPEGGGITVTAQPYWISESRRGATTRTRDDSRSSHRLILQILDQVKARAEQ